MTMIFSDWCNQNEQRNYPLVDMSDKDGDTAKLPNSLLVDLNIWLPASAGSGVFVSSASVTLGIVSVTFSAYGGLTNVPLCAISLPKPVDRYRKYALESFYPGAGGWVAFGGAIESTVAWTARFSDPAETKLLPKVVRAYDDLPVISAGKKSRAAALTGLVTLRGSSPVEVLACTDPWPLIGDPDYLSNPRYQRKIDGEPRDCIVARLIAAPDDYSNLYAYSAQCTKSPEDQQCGKALLQRINGVPPDCNGNIEIEFRNIPYVLLTDDDGKVLGYSLEYPLGLMDVCGATKGLVPQPIEDLCLPSASSESSSSGPISSQSVSSQSVSSSSLRCPPIIGEHIELFHEIDCWDRWAGTWTLEDCQLKGASYGGWGIIALKGSETFGHEFQTFTKLWPGSTGGKSYLIFAFESSSKFWYVELDMFFGTVVVGRRIGMDMWQESQVVNMPLYTDSYNHVRVQVGLTGNIQTWINGAAGPSVTAVPGQIADGPAGLALRYSSILFGSFAIDYHTIDPNLFPPFGCPSSSSL